MSANVVMVGKASELALATALVNAAKTKADEWPALWSILPTAARWRYVAAEIVDHVASIPAPFCEPSSLAAMRRVIELARKLASE